MSKRRVVITGLGVVTSLGETVDEMWDNVCAGKSGIDADHAAGTPATTRCSSAANAPTSTSQLR